MVMSNIDAKPTIFSEVSNKIRKGCLTISAAL